jgi:hypothetical protein
VLITLAYWDPKHLRAMVATHLSDRLSRSVPNQPSYLPRAAEESERPHYERPTNHFKQSVFTVRRKFRDNDLVQNSGAPFDQFNYSGDEGSGLMRMWSDAMVRCSDRRS